MNGNSSGVGKLSAGAAFANHLRERSASAALVLADRLSDLREHERAELLRAFVKSGDHVVPAEWWAPGATCRIALQVPDATAIGELWFDPLEVSCALVEPSVLGTSSEQDKGLGNPGLIDWVSLEPVAAWQVRGAHEITPIVPATADSISGEQSAYYAGLFGKGLVGSLDWRYLKAAYGPSIIARLWGDEEMQLGTFTPVSGDMEVLTLTEVLQWDAKERPELQLTSELFETGLPFRTVASVQHRDRGDNSALERTWNA